MSKTTNGKCLFWVAPVINGGKSLLLLNVSNVNRILVKCLSHWTACPHLQVHGRGNTTNPLGPCLGVRRIFMLLRLGCKESLQMSTWNYLCFQWNEGNTPVCRACSEWKKEIHSCQTCLWTELTVIVKKNCTRKQKGDCLTQNGRI